MTRPMRLAVASEATTDGTYRAVVHVGQDLSVTLDDPARWAGAFATAAAYAAYDAAFITHTTGTPPAMSKETTRWALDRIDDRRPPLNHADTAPLRLQPDVAVGTTLPFVRVRQPGGARFDLTVEHAHRHALAVLTAAAVAGCDNAYHGFARHDCSIDDTAARALVAELAGALREQL